MKPFKHSGEEGGEAREWLTAEELPAGETEFGAEGNGEQVPACRAGGHVLSRGGEGCGCFLERAGRVNEPSEV
ncbi:hypothetical protein GCM10027070_12470 [Barrientosiimonas humi]